MQKLRAAAGKVIGLLPDKPYVYWLYFKYHKRFANLCHPVRYTEMITWLKLYGRLERYSSLADKYEVREFVGKTIGEGYLIPLLGVYERFEDIPFDQLPDQFVLKGTHGCGYNVICRDKSKLDWAELRATFERWLGENFYRFEREPQYRDIRPRIVVEQYLEDDSGSLRDYKFYCTKGEPRLVQVDTDRFLGHKSVLMSPEWRMFESVQCSTFQNLTPPPCPERYAEMLEVVRRLAKAFPFVRVDLYVAGGRIYFGELTFTPGSGFAEFNPKKTGDQEFARILQLDLAAVQAQSLRF
jgi:hypothetical protein